MPRISVIIPVYNGADLIQLAIDSVLAQTCGDFELLVIDDGSTDDTASLVEAFDDPRIILHRFTNAGLAANRNRGLRLARGELVSFLDHDDIWLPSKLAAQVAALETYPQAGVAYCWVDNINRHGQPAGIVERIRVTGDALPHILQRNFIACGSNILFRRSLVEQVGMFDESPQPCEDWDYYIRLAEETHFVAVPESLVLYRNLPASMSSHIAELEQGCRCMLDQAYARLPSHFMPLKRKALGELYQYLTVRSMEKDLAYRSGWLSLLMWLNAVRYRPGGALSQWKLYIKLMVFIIITITVSPEAADTVRKKLEAWWWSRKSV